MKQWISHLSAAAMIEMLGITDQTVIAEYTNLMEELDSLIGQTFPDAMVTHGTYKGEIKDAMMHYELTFERPDDLEIL